MDFEYLQTPLHVTEHIWDKEVIPLVTVFSWVYNHKNFIAESIESILVQKTTFPIEIIIHDDASNDGTAEIIKNYETKYPSLFNNILHSENQWSQGKSVMTPLFEEPKGKYIALSHGDDYWTDPMKLQKQVDFLEANPEYSICSHNVNISVEDKEGNVLQQEEWLGKKHPETYTIRDLIKYGSGGATCSLVFRSKYSKDILDFFNKSKFGGGDLPLQIMCTQFGNMFYMREVMGVYRRNPSGICSTNSQVVIFDEFGVRKLNSINKYFKGKYQEEIDYSLYYYFYPNLANAYYANKNMFLYCFIRYKRVLLKIKYGF